MSICQCGCSYARIRGWRRTYLWTLSMQRFIKHRWKSKKLLNRYVPRYNQIYAHHCTALALPRFNQIYARLRGWRRIYLSKIVNHIRWWQKADKVFLVIFGVILGSNTLNLHLGSSAIKTTMVGSEKRDILSWTVYNYWALVSFLIRQ